MLLWATYKIHIYAFLKLKVQTELRIAQLSETVRRQTLQGSAPTMRTYNHYVLYIKQRAGYEVPSYHEFYSWE